MEVADWQILKCPSCGSLMRLKKGSRITAALCPTCNAKVTSPEPAAHDTPAPADEPSPSFEREQPSPIPRSRTFDPQPVRLRENKEAWEVRAPESKAPEFRESLASTDDPALAYDPENPPLRRKRISRSRKALTTWEDGAGSTHIKAKAVFWGLSKSQWLTVGYALLAAAVTFLVIKKEYFPSLRGTPVIEKTEAPPEPQIVLPSKPEDALEKEAVSEYYADVCKVAESFLKAPTLEEAKKYIRDPERVSPVMDAYYKQQAYAPCAYRELPKAEALVVHKRYIIGELLMDDYGLKPISFEKTPEGFKVDWESFVAYSEMSWAELREKRPEQSTLLRCQIKVYDYWNGDFADSKKYASFRLSDYEGKEYLYGYVQRRSQLLQQLSLELRDKTSSFCVLRVRYPKGAKAPEFVEITEFLESGWIIRPDDLGGDLEVGKLAPTDGKGANEGVSEKKPVVVPGASGP